MEPSDPWHQVENPVNDSSISVRAGNLLEGGSTQSVATVVTCDSLKRCLASDLPVLGQPGGEKMSDLTQRREMRHLEEGVGTRTFGGGWSNPKKPLAAVHLTEHHRKRSHDTGRP